MRRSPIYKSHVHRGRVYTILYTGFYIRLIRGPIYRALYIGTLYISPYIYRSGIIWVPIYLYIKNAK